ncbi:NETI motif-containing protein [Ureibacillus thermophilus]
MSKKTAWFEMEEHETPEQCIERMRKMGYMRS